MRGISLTGLYLTGSILIGTLVAAVLNQFLSYPFDRVLTRSVLLVMAILLIPLSKLVPSDTSGLVAGRLYFREFLCSFCVGLLILSIPIAFFLMVDLRVLSLDLDIDLGLIVLYLLFGVFLAGLIAVFEEILFRGFLYGALKNRFGQIFSMMASSSIYSCAHFLKPTGDGEYLPSLGVGFAYLGDAAVNAVALDHNWDARLSLLFLGCFLCLVRDRLSLFWCVGFHAAFVLGIFLTRELTTVNIKSEFLVLISPYNEFVGHFVSIWLALLILLLWSRSSISWGSSNSVGLSWKRIDDH